MKNLKHSRKLGQEFDHKVYGAEDGKDSGLDRIWDKGGYWARLEMWPGRSWGQGGYVAGANMGQGRKFGQGGNVAGRTWGK